MQTSSVTDGRKPVRALVTYGGIRGTTAKIADHIVQGLRQEGVDASSIPVSLLRMVPARVADVDLLGVGSPVYFLREPPDVTELISSLPSLASRKAFVFCTCGMDRPGETLDRLGSSLRARGAEIVGEMRFRTAMSYRPYRDRGLGNPDTLPDETQLAAAREFGARMARAKTLEPIPASAVPRSERWKARLLANRRFRRAFFPGVQIVSPECTGYGSCLSRCNVQAFARVDGTDIPEITSDCIQCLECLTDFCPRAAIEVDSPFKEWLSTVSYRLGIH